MYGDVETSNVEGLEHDLGSSFAVLWGVQWLCAVSVIFLIVVEAQRTGSVRRKWWSSGSTLRYLNIELDQKRSIRSCVPSVYSRVHLQASPYPVVYLTMPDRVVDAIARASSCGQSFVADEEVEVLGAALSRQMTTGPSSTSQV